MKRSIIALSLLLALTTLAACGSSVKSPSIDAFIAACKNAGGNISEPNSNGGGIAVDARSEGNWRAYYKQYNSVGTARLAFHPLKLLDYVEGIEASTYIHHGSYEAFSWAFEDGAITYGFRVKRTIISINVYPESDGGQAALAIMEALGLTLEERP